MFFSKLALDDEDYIITSMALIISLGPSSPSGPGSGEFISLAMIKQTQCGLTLL